MNRTSVFLLALVFTPFLLGDDEWQRRRNAIKERKVVVENEINFRAAWFLEDRMRGGKTPTMFLSRPGAEEEAGDDDQLP